LVFLCFSYPLVSTPVLLGILSPSIRITWPSQAILLLFTYLTIPLTLQHILTYMVHWIFKFCTCS
jgi:hypothetical protein